MEGEMETFGRETEEESRKSGGGTVDVGWKVFGRGMEYCAQKRKMLGRER